MLKRKEKKKTQNGEIRKIRTISLRDIGARVGQGGRRLENGACTDYDVMMTSEFKF